MKRKIDEVDGYKIVRIAQKYILVKRGLSLIKTKVNHPYVYFFMEPNVVIVYKIGNNNYLTVSDLSGKGE